MRTVQFVEAQKIFGRCGDLDERGCSSSILVELESCFLRWYERYAAGRVGRISPRSDGSGGWIFLRLFNRFMEDYKARVRRELWLRLKDVQWHFMITLTMSPMGSLPVEFAYVSRRWCRVRAWLFKWFRSFSFVKVLEITERGRPHLHVLVSGTGCSRIETEDLYDAEGRRLFFGLRTVWGHFVKVRGCWPGFSAAAYVLKYVYKSLACGLDGLGLRYAALLFASNKRVFSMDKVLSQGCRSCEFFNGVSTCKKCKRVFSMSKDLSSRKVLLSVSPTAKIDKSTKFACGERPPVSSPAGKRLGLVDDTMTVVDPRPPISVPKPKRKWRGCCDAEHFDVMLGELGLSKDERFYKFEDSSLSSKFPLVWDGFVPSMEEVILGA